MKTISAFRGLALGLVVVLGCAHTPSESDVRPELPRRALPEPIRTSRTGGATPVAAGRISDNVPYTNSGAVYYPAGAREGAAIALEKLVPEDVDAGAPFEYRIVVTSVSSTPLEDVLVKETFDENFSFKEARPPGNAGPGRTMAFDLGTLPPGASRTITITGSAAKPGSVATCATVDFKVATCAVTRVSAPALRVMTTMTSDVVSCDVISGKITVSNPGTSVTRGVRITDVLPDGLTTTDGRTSIEIDVGELRSNESREYGFVLRASRTGKFVNVATATAEGQVARQSAPVSVTVRQPVLSVKIECPSGAMGVGRTGTYRFVVRNTGDAPAVGAVLRVDVPNSMEFKSADGGGTVAGTTLTFPVGVLAVNETRKMSATYVRGVIPGVVSARAQLVAECAVEQRDWCEVGGK